MSKAGSMGVSPSEVSSQTENHLSPRQTTPEQTCKFGAEFVHSEPSESKHLIGSEAAQNEPQGTSSAVTKSPDSEKIQAFCEDVPDNSLTERVVVPLEDVSKSSQTNNTSCPQQNTSELKHEIGSECMRIEQSEQKLHIAYNDPRETSLVTYSSADKEILQPVSEDVSKSSQTDNKQSFVFSSRNGCGELVAGCVRSETSEQIHQLGSEIIPSEPAHTDAPVHCGGVHENLRTVSEDMTKYCPAESLQSTKDADSSCQIGEESCPQQYTLERILQVTAKIASHEPLEVNNNLDSHLVQNKPAEISSAVSCNIATGQLGSPPELMMKSSPIEHLKPEFSIPSPIPEHLAPSSGDLAKNSTLKPSETSPKCAVTDSRRLVRKGKRASKSLNKKYMLRSKINSDRVLRSRSGEKPKASESIKNLADVNVSSIGGREKRKQKDKRGKRIAADEYSRIRRHLRYLLNRINYEKSLIAAYSSEGWKGLSLEKLKPEKELERATAEILRRKLKIRDLFQCLDSLCTEGAFPKALFDSEGQIDSEDIFCAKCGSKDLTADNDIILCDGACDRGFHQYCLEPPLLKEDIPPDDDGWLCPGCDCKVDCIDLVNESQGTNLCITENWEKVFPEAAAGNNQDPNFGLPSDDSDDNDYDPDGPPDENDQADDSSSDESDFTSTSNELEASANDKEYLGLPSDDSEDDDFNPDAPKLDEEVNQDSSSSDFTSDSEDLAAVFEDNGSSGNEEGTTSVSPIRDSNGQRSQLDENKESLNNKLLSTLESGEDATAPAYVKRRIERLDYKKLYDEAYRNVPSSSSDDEDWTVKDGPRKRKKTTREGSSMALNNAPVTSSENLKDTNHTPQRKGRQKLNAEDTKSHEGSSTPGSGKREKSSYKRLGEDVTQKLYKCFKENQYPDRTTKETLAKELGLTISQVRKWFENTRWSFNHSSSRYARMGKNASEKSTCTPESNKKSVKRVSTCNVDSPTTGIDDSEHSSGDVKDSELATQECSKRTPTAKTHPKRKRNGKLGHQASDPDSRVEVTKNLPADPRTVQEMQTNGRTLRKRKSTV